MIVTKYFIILEMLFMKLKLQALLKQAILFSYDD
jgi:hypothetical protein